MHPRGPRNA
uniref:Uncharacterized protein n=1 Tax=Anguilla anguilla TaxID=7936 RepID=A0A0E9XJB8_ANGAN